MLKNEVKNEIHLGNEGNNRRKYRGEKYSEENKNEEVQRGRSGKLKTEGTEVITGSKYKKP